jgi:hypothetical protein
MAHACTAGEMRGYSFFSVIVSSTLLSLGAFGSGPEYVAMILKLVSLVSAEYLYLGTPVISEVLGLT